MRDLMGTGHIWFQMSTATRPKMPDLAQFAHRFPRRPADVFHTYEKAGRIAKLFWSVAEDCQVLLDPDCDPGAAERPQRYFIFRTATRSPPTQARFGRITILGTRLRC